MKPLSLIALASLSLLPTSATARDWEPVDRGADDRPTVPDDVDFEPNPSSWSCRNPAPSDPEPWPDVVVGGTGSPSLPSGLAELRAVGDLNGDGVATLCVEPGIYGGGSVVPMSDFVVPILIHGRAGSGHTTILASEDSRTRGLAVLGSPVAPSSRVDADVTIRGFTIRGFEGTGGGPPWLTGGAGLYLRETSAHLDDLVLSGNSDPTQGAGVYAEDVALRVDDCTFAGNYAPTGGGLAVAYGSTRIEGTRFEANLATRGGGLHALARPDAEDRHVLSVLDTHIVGNIALGSPTALDFTAPDGGGAGLRAVGLDRVVLQRSVLTDNLAGDWPGGAVQVLVPDVQIRRTDFERNEAHTGGAVMHSAEEGRLEILGGTFHGNTAAGELVVGVGSPVNNTGYGGGAIQALDLNALEIVGTSLTGNGTTEGAGGAVQALRVRDVAMVDCVVGDNHADGGAGRGGGLYAGSIPSTQPVPSVRLTGGDWSDNTAWLGGGAVHAGTEWDFPLHSDSSAAAISGTVFTNNRAEAPGAARGGAVLFEGRSAVVVDATFEGNHAEQGGGGLWSRQDVAVAGALFQDNTVTYGWGAGLCYLGQNYGTNTLTVVDSEFTGNSAVLSALGAGAYVRGSNFGMVTTASFARVLFDDNKAGTRQGAPPTQLTGSRGGGLAGVGRSELTLATVQFVDNNADHGGGLAVLTAPVVGTDLHFEGNGARIKGGGLSADRAFGGSTGTQSVGGLDLSDTRFVDNHAGDYGGGVYLGGNNLLGTAPLRTADLVDVDFELNTADQGGGLHAVHADLVADGGDWHDNAALQGAAVFVDDDSIVVGRRLSIHRNVSAGNPIRVRETNLTLVNTLVAGNPGADAILATSGSELTLVHATIAGNGGGVDASAQTVMLANTVVALNDSLSQVAGGAGSTAFASYAFHPAASSPWAVTNIPGVIQLNPLFVADGASSASGALPSTYSTPYDFTLFAGSPLIDAGIGASDVNGTAPDVGAWGGPTPL